MKAKIRILVISALLSLFTVPSFALEGSASKFSSAKDSMDYTRSLSFYKEFYKIKLYTHAREPWLDLFEKYPAASEKLYIDGVKMYRHFIQAVSDGSEKDFYIDTLMLIYDQRIDYFGGEGNVLGRQGSDLLAHGRKDIDKVQQAFSMLERSIELEGIKSRTQVVLNYLSAGMILNYQERLDDDQVIAAYLTAADISDQNQGKSSRWKKTRASLNELMYEQDLFSCEALTSYFEPRFEQNQDNKIFLNSIIVMHEYSACESSDIYMAASENLYRLAPEAESAYNLAKLYTARGDYSNAIKYLQAAVESEDSEVEIRAEWLYKLSVVSMANNEYCKAISYARESIALKGDYGKAFMALGDAIVAYGYSLDDDFEQRAAFWAAADKYSQASLLEPSMAEEAKQKMNAYKEQYPDKEEIFFRDLKEGSSYRVKGCINETTTVMARR